MLRSQLRLLHTPSCPGVCERARRRNDGRRFPLLLAHDSGGGFSVTKTKEPEVVGARFLFTEEAGRDVSVAANYAPPP